MSQAHLRTAVFSGLTLPFEQELSQGAQRALSESTNNNSIYLGICQWFFTTNYLPARLVGALAKRVGRQANLTKLQIKQKTHIDLWVFCFLGWVSCYMSYDICSVPGARLELARFCNRGILSPLCLPFHHPGIFSFLEVRSRFELLYRVLQTLA